MGLVNNYTLKLNIHNQQDIHTVLSKMFNIWTNDYIVIEIRGCLYFLICCQIMLMFLNF